MKIKKFNCRPKLDKPVVIPTRKQLLPILNDLKSQLVDKVFTIEEIINLIGIYIGKRFRVDVVHGYAQEVDQNDIDLNAYYDSGHDEAGETSIELYLITNPLDKTILLNEEEFDCVAKRIVDSITHEIIHMKQSRSRDFLEIESFEHAQVDDEQLENKLYLGNLDEVDAYAYNIAEELLECSNYKKKLENPSTVTTRESANLWAYIQTFESGHPVLKRLLKKIYKNLSNRVN
jgi:hypothetical protein